MKNIISISRRTDIPAFYLKWLLGRLCLGEVSYKHPGGGNRTISLRPPDVHTLVFWSKDYSRFLNNSELREHLRLYSVYFHFSITGLGGSFIESRVPSHEVTLEQLREMTHIWGAERIEWRFDPIVFLQRGAAKYTNFSEFRSLALRVRQTGVTKCTFSFATPYRKNLLFPRRYQFQYIFPGQEERTEMLMTMLSIGSSAGIELYACSDFSSAIINGINKARCIDGDRLTWLHPQKEKAASGKDRSQRAQCLCSPSIDIGSYEQACPHGCLYCYANPAVSDFLIRSLLDAMASEKNKKSEPRHATRTLVAQMHERK